MTFTFGIDVSTKRIAIACYGDGVADVGSVDIKQDVRGAARLVRVRRAALKAARRHVHYPSLIVVEDANVGAAANKPLIQAVGVVLEAMAYAYTCPVAESPIGTWKKAALGRGNAVKADVWEGALAHGFAPENQDEADAACVAVAAYRGLVS